MDLQAAEGTIVSTCSFCSNTLQEDMRFCPHCGALQQSEIIDADERSNYMTWLIIFFAIDLVCCLAGMFLPSLKDLTGLLVLDSVMFVNTIVFCIAARKEIVPLLQWKNFSFGRFLLYALLAVVSSLAIQLLVGWLNQALFEDNVFYYSAFSGTSWPQLFMFLMIAVYPALVEEFGYRGFMQGMLSGLLDARQAIFISSFLFALLHLSFVSFFWLLPFGLLLAHLRVKENTIWYGVVFHFIFNGTACAWELYSG